MDSLTQKVSDLRRLADERRGQNLTLTRNLQSSSMNELTDTQAVRQSQVLPTPQGHTKTTDSEVASTRSSPPRGRSHGHPRGHSRSGSPSRGMAYGTVERPASRAEISALEIELEEKVRLVLDSEYKRSSDEFGAAFVYEPHRENMLVTREKMLKDFGATSSDLNEEPWLETYVQCESLKQLCDDISTKFADMLGVSSSELGNIARKLRLTYSQCFHQMMLSWKSLRTSYRQSQDALRVNDQKIGDLGLQLENKEEEVSRRFDSELARITKEFTIEKDRDKEKLLQAELKVDQMSDTLKYLNGIFRTMQVDGPALKTADLQAQNARLEKENRELRAQNSEFESMKTQLILSLQKGKQLEAQIKQLDNEITRLNLHVSRREEVINSLMEREALRNAEIEKLQKISKMKDDEMLSMDMQDPATSVLCIKCKKSLDDMTNIRAALIGDNSMGGKVVCEAYRILLPNLRGKKPHRSVHWLRACVRSILLSKMREEGGLIPLRAEVSRLPGFVYSWFTRPSDGLVGAMLTRVHAQCDEDRWALYYGLKAMCKEDSEMAVFWSLLDETFGSDGLNYLLYCLSVAMTLGGMDLWRQFGSTLTVNASVEAVREEDCDKPKAVRAVIWFPLPLARQATQVILSKALGPQVAAAMEAIEALKARPPADDMPAHSDAPTGSTHINIFTWLRLMLQQLQADQIHRAAAIRLMFETASVGALTPANNGSGADKSNQGGQHVEFPQFWSICQTLFPFLSSQQAGDFYSACHATGKKRVTAEIFTVEADHRGYFSQALKLSPLPLIRNVATALSENAHLDGESQTGLEYTLKTSLVIRSKLAALVHRKVAALAPALKFVSVHLPERYKLMLSEALQAVHTALQDSFAKLKELQMEQLAQGTGYNSKTLDMHKSSVLDGLGPFIAYRRLVSLVLLLRAVTDNPLLPTEIFSTGELSNDEGQIRQALFSAEKLLTNLDQALLLPMATNRNRQVQAILTRHNRFELVRRALIARRIQLAVRRFLAKDVPVPRSVRFLMAAGYLSNNRSPPGAAGGATSASAMLPFAPHAAQPVQALKAREVYHDPWWAQSHVASILLFKLAHDSKSGPLGLPPLALEHAVCAYKYHLWGSIDMAERAVHDLFTSIRAYRMAVPRLRLFAAFLGDGKDLDEAVARMLTTPQALSIYFHLLFDIHRELKRHEDRIRAAGASTADDRSRPGSGDAMTKAMLAAGSIKHTAGGRKELTADMLEIECLFPSSEDSFLRGEHRECFLVDPSVLKEVAKRFATSQPWLKGRHNIYTDLPERMRTDTQGRTDVDDFLYICLVQWARLASFHLMRSNNRTQALEASLSVEDGVMNITAEVPTGASTATGVDGGPSHGGQSHVSSSTPKANDKSTPRARRPQGVISRRVSMMPLSNLKNIVESIYRPGEAIDLADPLHYAVAYIYCIRSRRNNLYRNLSNAQDDAVVVVPGDDAEAGGAMSAGDDAKQTAEGGGSPGAKHWDDRVAAEMRVLLKECVLWDTNLGIFNPLTLAQSSNYSVLTNGPVEADKAHPKLLRANTSKVVAAATMRVMSCDEDGPLAVFLHTPPVKVYSAVFPEVDLMTSKAAFAAYQQPFNQLLNRTGEDPRFMDNNEVRARVQALRIHLLALTDFFQSLDLHYVSPKLHTLSVLYGDEANDELMSYAAEKQKYAMLAGEARAKVQALMSSVAELATMTQQDFPRDHWQAGTKLALERSFVYSIHTKNALI